MMGNGIYPESSTVCRVYRGHFEFGHLFYVDITGSGCPDLPSQRIMTEVIDGTSINVISEPLKV